MTQTSVPTMKAPLAAVLLIPLLLPSGCLAPLESNNGTPALPDAGPELLGFSWNTTKTLGFTAVRIHVSVPEGSRCNATLTARMSISNDLGPTSLMMLEAPGERGTSGAMWRSGGAVFRVHTPDADSQDFLGLPSDNISRHVGGSIHINATAQDGLDAFVIGNITPYPSNPGRGIVDWGKSIQFDYSCDRPTSIQVSQGEEIVLLNGRNAYGGTGVQLSSTGQGLTIQDDEIDIRMASPNVTVLAEVIASDAMSISIRADAPHGSKELSLNPTTTRRIAGLRLDDGPGDYTVEIDNIQPDGRGGYVVALLGTNPLPGLDALS